MKALRLLLVAGVALAVISAGGAGTKTPAITWTTVAWGGMPHVFHADRGYGPACQRDNIACASIQNTAIRRNPIWEAFASNGSDTPVAQRILKVDYDKYVLVAAWSDRRPSGADSIEIRSIEQRGRTLKLGAVIHKCDGGWPTGGIPSGCIATVVYAYHLVLVPKASLTKPYPNRAVIDRWQRPATR